MRAITPPWLEALVELIANAMEAHSALGPLGYRYRCEDELWEIVLYPTPVALHGGPEDGMVVSPGFSLDLKQVLETFEEVLAAHWTAHPFSPSDCDHPSVSIEGRYQGRAVFLRILAEAPDDEPPGLAVEIPSADHGGMH